MNINYVVNSFAQPLNDENGMFLQAADEHLGTLLGGGFKKKR